MILGNSSSCHQVDQWTSSSLALVDLNPQALEQFSYAVGAKTLNMFGNDFGKHWESDQNVVTAQLLRYQG